MTILDTDRFFNYLVTAGFSDKQIAEIGMGLVDAIINQTMMEEK